MNSKLRSIFSKLREPVEAKTQEVLDQKWNELPSELKSLQQIYGLNEEGCGATIGVMPKCDFACQGCYLSKSANSVPAAPLEEIKEQLIQLRDYLGKWGNLQLTDGEVTLRDERDIIEILKMIREVELIPMLMTHGDVIRKNPDLLKTLMIEGGLSEVSFHVDITQKGRMGDSYKHAKTEKELNPLREEFVNLVREIRRETKLPLRVATTMTITPANLVEIPELLRFFMKHSDVFRLVSFLPVAQVGRTLDGYGGGVSQDALWKKVSEGLYGNDVQKSEDMKASRWWMGHPDCSQFTMGFVRKELGDDSYSCISMNTDNKVCLVLNRFFKNFKGITFRADSKSEAIARFLGMMVKDPNLMLVQLPKLLWYLLGKMSATHRFQEMFKIMKGNVRYERFTIVGHHFMSDDEIKTDLGQERIEQCTFKVSHKGELVSMCEFNATTYRKDYYDSLINVKGVE